MIKFHKFSRNDLKKADSVLERRNLLGADKKCDQHLVSQAEAVYNGFRQFRDRRAMVIDFVYGDQWGAPITVNGKTMTQREYLVKNGNTALQANLLTPKANSIVGAHIKENTCPYLKARKRSLQPTIEVLSEAMVANWDNNDMTELIANVDFELMYGGMGVMKESFERLNGENDAISRMVNPNMFAFQSAMQDSRMTDINMTVELHEYTPNEFYAAFAKDMQDVRKFQEMGEFDDSPLRFNDEYDVSEKNDQHRVLFRYPADTRNFRVIEIWTKERRPRYHVFDQNAADLYDINADDYTMIRSLEDENKRRVADGKAMGIDEETINKNLILMIPFFDTYWYYRFITPKGYILDEGESKLPDRDYPYTIVATPMVNGLICGYLYPAVDLQMALNRELVVYDWMKRLGTKGVTFVPQSIIPDGMSYEQFAEQWTSMDGIVYYKPNNNGDKPFVEHSSVGNLNTAEMMKMFADTMADTVATSGALQGKQPYAGTSAALYAQQKENSTTPIAVISNKLDTFVKHVALKKARFIQLYYNINQFAEVADGMDNLDLASVDFAQIGNLKNKLKVVLGADRQSLRQENNELLMNMVQLGALNVRDALDLGDFSNADAIIERLDQRAAEMQQQQQMQIGNDYANKLAMMRGQRQAA